MVSEALRDSSRFELVRRVGAGAMGVVYEARRRATGERVALKALHALDAPSLYRLKRAFRAHQEMAHENLIRFTELVEEGGVWYMVMEYVDGTDTLTYVRGGGAPDYERARAVVAQIARGLDCLHEAGHVHRDLKPSNVLVEPRGRVVVLDFGLAIGMNRGPDSSDIIVAGTLPYMAPEQLNSQAVGPPADCYALGALLYELLTGRWPFVGAPMDILTAKLTKRPPPPRALAPDVPEDLDRLCLALLEIDPAKRPSARTVADQVEPHVERSEPAVSIAVKPPASDLVLGREAELARLHQALAASRRESQIVVIVGSSGIGKSSLLARFADEARAADPGTIVLTARCHQQEFVPFKAFDAIVDGLSSVLRRMPVREAAALLPRHPGALVAVFPVLSRVDAFAAAPSLGAGAADPQERRELAFTALRETLKRLADRRPLALLIDDFQWADLDSIRLLRHLLRPLDAPPALVVIATRDDDTSSAMVQQIGVTHTPPFEIVLGPLPEAAADELVTRLADEAGLDREIARLPISAEAGHHPLHIQELLWHVAREGATAVPIRLEDAIAARVERLEPHHRDLLALISVAGTPITSDALHVAMSAPPACIAKELAELTRGHFIRCASTSCEGVEPFHDRVRETVLAGLEEEQVRRSHEQLAVAMEQNGDLQNRPELVVEHFVAAGAIQRAAAHAKVAAAEAARRLAFKRAAELYAIALQDETLTRDGRCELTTRRAEALRASGLLLESAAEYGAAAALAEGRARIPLETRRVEQMLRAGQLHQGLAAATELLAKVGVKVPPTWKRTLLGLAIEQVRLRLRGLEFEERAEADVDPDVLQRLDVLWLVSTGFSFVSPPLGRVLQIRFLREALAAGELRRAVLGYSLEIAHRSMRGVPAREGCEELLAQTRVLAKRLDVAEVTGFMVANAGLASYLTGRYREGHERIREGELLMRQNPLEMSWVLDLCEIYRVAALWILGELRELVRVHPDYLRAAEERGDVYAQRGLCGWRSNVVWLVRDEPDEARAQARRAALARGPGEPFHLHHYFDLVAHTMIELYTRNGEAALARMEAAWKDIEGSHLLGVQHIHVDSLWLRGAAAVAGARIDRGRLAIAEACAKRLDKVDAPQASVVGPQLQGAIHLARGDRDGAIRSLRAAIAAADRHEMAAHGAVARLRLGRVLGDDEGRALIDIAEDWMSDQGVANPRAFVEMLSPSIDDGGSGGGAP